MRSVWAKHGHPDGPCLPPEAVHGVTACRLACPTSTGTSEDVEALAREVCPCSDDPDGTHVPDLDAGCGWALALCRAVLASDWLAAHDAATADRVLTEAADELPGHFPVGEGPREWLRRRAACIAREQAR